MKAVFVLTPAESKRLIAKAVAVLPEIKQAMADGMIVFAAGTTNVFVVEELLREKVPDKGRFVLGVITEGLACATPEAKRGQLFVLQNGRPADIPFAAAITRLGPGNVFVKGANAVDPQGRVGILAGNPNGGTLGRAKAYLGPQGAGLIVPVGLEKLVPSVPAAAAFAAWEDIDASIGFKTNLLPIDIAGQRVVTEIEALALLAGVRAELLGAGGIGGSEGAVALGITGEPEQVRAALDLIKAIKGEPPVSGLRMTCAECEAPCDWVK